MIKKILSIILILSLLSSSIYANDDINNFKEKVIFYMDEFGKIPQNEIAKENATVMELPIEEFKEMFPEYKLIRKFIDKDNKIIMYEARTEEEYQSYIKIRAERELEEMKEKQKFLKSNKNSIQTMSRKNACQGFLSNSNYGDYDFKEGQILVKRYKYTPKWDSFGTTYHHVGIVTEDNDYEHTSVVEAAGSCGKNCNRKNEVLIDKMSSLKSWKKGGEYNTEDESKCNPVKAIKVLNVKSATNSIKNKAVKYAIKLANGNTIYGVTSNKESTDKTYCSKLAYQSYKKYGVDIDNGATFYVTPDDILDDKDTKTVWSVWFN